MELDSTNLPPLPVLLWGFANAIFQKKSSFLSYSGIQAKLDIFSLESSLTPDTMIMITHAFQVHLSQTDAFVPNKGGVTADWHDTIAKQPVMAADKTIATTVTHDI